MNSSRADENFGWQVRPPMNWRATMTKPA